MVIASALIKTASETAKEIFYGTECVRGGRGCVGVGVCVGGFCKVTCYHQVEEKLRSAKDT